MAPKAWAKKDEKQYKAIKHSLESQGKGEKTAKRIAAATVNKERKSEGRTKEQKARRVSKGKKKK